MDGKLSVLYPPFAKTVEAFVVVARARGFPVSVFSGLRTIDEQAAIYAKGRDAHGNIVDRRAVVSYAKPGRSLHNYGLAVDIVFDGNLTKPGVQWSWSENLPWESLARMGRDKFGLEAGYFWTRQDPPHYQLRNAPHPECLYSIYVVGGMIGVWNTIDGLKIV